jgi:hypothetical protein
MSGFVPELADAGDHHHRLHAPPLDLFKNKRNRQANLSPASKGWILGILPP